MTHAIDPVELAQRLIACPSVTPDDAGTFDLLEGELTAIGFAVERFMTGEAPDGPVENMIATCGSDTGRHFAFAGHVDVVPAGDGWSAGAFAPEIRGGLLYGRGAVDMKGAIAAFIAAASQAPVNEGRLTLLLTGDEEGPAIYGTRAIMDRMAMRAMRPDMILVGEPTSERRLGDTVKIGRRGSVNIWIDVPGTQGHVAYPHLASNPIPAIGRLIAALEAFPLDNGNDWFQPSNLEITELAAGNQACNVIPGLARLRLNIRFNDQQKGADLVGRITQLVNDVAPDARVEAKISGEAFLTPPGALSALVLEAITVETGLAASLSTSGGTSDARFLSALCPVVEFGLVNATMHKIDEAVAIDDLHRLSAIYQRIIRSALG